MIVVTRSDTQDRFRCHDHRAQQQQSREHIGKSGANESWHRKPSATVRLVGPNLTFLYAAFARVSSFDTGNDAAAAPCLALGNNRAELRIKVISEAT